MPLRSACWLHRALEQVSCAVPFPCSIGPWALGQGTSSFWPKQVASVVSAWLAETRLSSRFHTLVTFSHGKEACPLQVKLSNVLTSREKCGCLCQEMDLEPEVRWGLTLACSAVAASCRTSCNTVPAVDVRAHMASLVAAISTVVVKHGSCTGLGMRLHLVSQTPRGSWTDRGTAQHTSHRWHDPLHLPCHAYPLRTLPALALSRLCTHLWNQPSRWTQRGPPHYSSNLPAMRCALSSDLQGQLPVPYQVPASGALKVHSAMLQRPAAARTCHACAG